MDGIPDLEPLEQSVKNVTLDDGYVDDLSQLEPLEHLVLNMAQDNGLAQGRGEPMFGSDRGLTFTEIPDAMRNVDLGLGAAVPFPADDNRKFAEAQLMTVICASLISIRRDFGVGTRIDIF